MTVITPNLLRSQGIAISRPAKHRSSADQRVHDGHVIDGGVHYARNGTVRLAYRVLGEGEPTLV